MKFNFIVMTAVLISTPLAQAAGGQSCGKIQGEVLYHARFDWPNGTSGKKTSTQETTRDLEIIIVKTAKPGFWDSKVSARIMNHGDCEAICRAENLEIVSNGPSDAKIPAVATSMDMTCRSSSLGALGAPATVFFSRGQEGSQTPVLRFGSWLQGYEQAYLKVERDQSFKLVKEMRPEKTPNNAKERLELANAR